MSGLLRARLASTDRRLTALQCGVMIHKRLRHDRERITGYSEVELLCRNYVFLAATCVVVPNRKNQ
jgi:hypothetical protein